MRNSYIIGLIDKACEEMVQGVEDTISETVVPSAYYNDESYAEINSVYQFVKFFENQTKTAIYLEYPCDSGRVDAVIVLENNVILLEAKQKINPKKFKVLNAQATRFEHESIEYDKKEKWLQTYYKDKSLHDYLAKIQVFIEEKWGIKKPIELYGVLLADTNETIQEKRWGDSFYYDSIKLETIKNYTHIKIRNKIQTKLIHLFAYKSLGFLTSSQ